MVKLAILILNHGNRGLIMKCKIDQQYLRSIFYYNKETGLFVRTVKTSNRVKVGDVAGYKDRQGYLIININRTLYRAHRLAWLYVYGKFPENDIDHINGIKDDNRILNLRDVTNSENHRNMKMSKRNKSGFTGIRWSEKQHKWLSRIHTEGKEIHLGSFIELSDAINSRELAENELGFHANHGKI